MKRVMVKWEDSGYCQMGWQQPEEYKEWLEKLPMDCETAGFLFNHLRNWSASDYWWMPIDYPTKGDREKVWVPTLSELIEACGDGHIALERIRKSDDDESLYWHAFSVQKGYLFHGNGDTPEYAVANLWLGLNRKDAE